MRKPVIFLPGFPASGLHHTTLGRDIFPPSLPDLVTNRQLTVSRLIGPDDPDAEQTVTTNGVIRKVSVLGFEISREADTLFHILRRMGYTEGEDFRPIPWDWRLPVSHRTVRERIRTTVDDLHREYGPVVVLAHSTGGLVIRSVLETLSAQDGGRWAAKVDHVVAMAVPWAGTLKTLRYVGPGGGEAGLSADDMRRIIGGAWAAWDLMPPDPAQTDLTDDRGHALDLFVDSAGWQAGPLVDRRWMAAHPEFTRRADAAHRAWGRRARTFSLPPGVPPVPVTNLAGWGVPTETRYQLNPAGTAMTAETTDEGDGTVPFVSAVWLRGAGVRTFPMALGRSGGFIPEFHSQIWDTPQSTEVLDHVLRGAPLTEVISVALDNDAAVRGGPVVPIRVGACDSWGAPLPGATVRFAPAARQPSQRVALVNGRATIVYRVGARPPSGPYRTPVIVEWTGPGGRTERRTIDRYFHA